MSDITQAQANAVLGAARESARETGTAMNIAVVDTPSERQDRDAMPPARHPADSLRPHEG